MTDTLDSFQRDLLAQLRAHVAALPAEDTHARPSADPSHSYAQPADVAAATPRAAGLRARRPRHLATAVGVAAAAAVAIAVGMTSTARPAYAVSETDGVVHVSIDRLQDAAALERELRDTYRVDADVQYLGHGLRCQDGRFVPERSAPDSATAFSFGHTGLDVKIDRRDLTKDSTVVIAVSDLGAGVAGEVGIARGPVEACTPKPAR